MQDRGILNFVLGESSVQLSLLQTDSEGDYQDTCRGYVITDSTGYYTFTTTLPGERTHTHSTGYYTFTTTLPGESAHTHSTGYYTFTTTLPGESAHIHSTGYYTFTTTLPGERAHTHTHTATRTCTQHGLLRIHHHTSG